MFCTLIIRELKLNERTYNTACWSKGDSNSTHKGYIFKFRLDINIVLVNTMFKKCKVILN